MSRNLNIVYCIIFGLICSCSSTYRIKSAKKIEKKITVDKNLIVRDFILCYVNKGSLEINFERQFEDSVINLLLTSFNNNSIDIIKENGRNVVNYDHCSPNKWINSKRIKKYLEIKIKNDSIIKNETILFPIIEIREVPSPRLPGDRTTSINVSLGLTFFLFQKKKLIFQVSGKLISIENPWYLQSEKDWENDDYSKIPIDNHIQPAHWDTLVGLGMKEYIEQLNRIE